MRRIGQMVWQMIRMWTHRHELYNVWYNFRWNQPTRILILSLNSRRNKNLYHSWTADAFVISLDVQPHIIMWDYYSNQKGPPGIFFILFCVSLRIRRAPAVSAHIQQQFSSSLSFSSVRCAPGSGLPSFLLVHRSLPPPPPCASLQPMCCCVGCSLYAICIRTRWVGRPWHQIEVAARNTLPLSSSGHRMKALILRLYTYIVTLSNVALDLENVTMAAIWSINSFYNVSISSSTFFILFN